MKLDSSGLIPSVVQDAATGEVLIVAYTNPEALKRSLDSGQVWLYSRSRKEIWHKGATSGNYMDIKEILVDCDRDAIVFKVDPKGPACHTGNISCFVESVDKIPEVFEPSETESVINELFKIIEARRGNLPDGSYTADLLKSGVSRIAQKVIEEAGETALAASEGNKEELQAEAADLIYHLLVLLSSMNSTPEAVYNILRNRRG